MLDGQRWRAAVGRADLAGTPASADMTFRIASITKPLVAVLALRAVAAGDLALDAPLAPRLGGVLRPDPPITLRQVLGHTSGIFEESNAADITADIARLPDPELRELGEVLLARYRYGERVVAPAKLLVAAAETHPRVFAPGSRWVYSNTGYQVAGMAVEQATGQSLAALLAADITTPLHLTRTTLAPPDLSSPQLRGYDLPGGGALPIDVTDDLATFGNGANGGVISTPDELASIFIALMQGRLVPQATVEEMLTPTAQSLIASTAYGLGLAEYSLSCGTFYGHEGGVNGTASLALVNRSGTQALVVALNARSDADPGLVRLADRVLCPAG